MARACSASFLLSCAIALVSYTRNVCAVVLAPRGNGDEALPFDLLMPELSNVSLPLANDPVLRDISKTSCWVGHFTEDNCCKHHNPDCWDDNMIMAECCPNADCWERTYNYEECCSGKPGVGNPLCWGDVYNYARCCALSEPSTTWVDNLYNGQTTEDFYSFDEFYNDAQYGADFGYYSTGRVIGAGKFAKDANEFAHFTTFPMALAPHFGRVIMRSILLMWQEQQRRQGTSGDDVFQVVEMGAGSGQLAKDIRDCVVTNCLRLPEPLNTKWQKAFHYTILERSPALAERQRERGIEVVINDAQTVEACEVLREKATRKPFSVDVVISNELIDAFAPIKMKLSVFDLDNVRVSSCSSWTEVKLLHLIKKRDVTGMFAQELSLQEPHAIVRSLESFTHTFFCDAVKTSVGQVAMSVVPQNTTCMILVLALSDVMEMSNLQIPAASNNVRMRLRKDALVQAQLRKRVRELSKDLQGFLAIPRNIYRTFRAGLKNRGLLHQNLDVTFMLATKTKRISVPITPTRCEESHIGSFLERHRARTERLARFYHDLGYPSMYILMRPGEEEFLHLADCLLNQDRLGHILTIDYGASFEPLSHSLSVDPLYDGIFVPPIPDHLMAELPNCHNDWTVCAGRIDWTTFVDFTNMAAVGNELGFETVWYGPQTFIEQMGETGLDASIPGYSIVENVNWVNRHAVNWYGREKGEPWQQRWTAFKGLLQRVPPLKDRDPDASGLKRLSPVIEPIQRTSANNHRNYNVVAVPSWHLDTAEVDPCWLFDPTNLPIADWADRNMKAANATLRQVFLTLTSAVDRGLGLRFASGYEEAQLSVRLVDFIVEAVGCMPLFNPDSITLTWSSWYKARWEQIWKPEILDFVGPIVLQIISDEAQAILSNTTRTSRHYPFECMARQQFRILCGSST